MLTRTNSQALFEKAKTYFPGGVNSPVRAFKAVNGTPLFIDKGDGSHIWDADGNEFIDFCNSWGPLILGHNHPSVREYVIDTIKNGTSFGAPTRKENELAELILSNHRFIEKIRFVSSGTEAAMSALRLARGFTGRDKIIKFEGCYHGHVDALLVNAGSGLVTLGESSSAGIPRAYAEETIVLPLNNREAVEEAFRMYKDQIRDFLQFLREICTANGTLLLFDEVISGFRIGFEGAAGYYNIQPDVIAFGKIIGGGFPVGAYGASAAVMSHVSPDGPVYQAGTLSGNPVAMAAGYAQLKECLEPGFYESLRKKTDHLVSSVQAYADVKGYMFRIFSIESIFWIAFTDQVEIRKASEINPSSMQYFKKLHESLLEDGVYLGPSGYEVGFISAAHTEEDIAHTILAFHKALDVAFAAG
jgi:glutamate-1-semialdehyde 2,1-aminomutase